MILTMKEETGEKTPRHRLCPPVPQQCLAQLCRIVLSLLPLFTHVAPPALLCGCAGILGDTPKLSRDKMSRNSPSRFTQRRQCTPNCLALDVLPVAFRGIAHHSAQRNRMTRPRPLVDDQLPPDRGHCYLHPVHNRSRVPEYIVLFYKRRKRDR